MALLRTPKPYGAGEDEDQQDPYLRRGGAADRQYGGAANTPPQTAPAQPPESAPPTDGGDDVPRPQTFQEMQAAGMGRPPMPAGPEPYQPEGHLPGAGLPPTDLPADVPAGGDGFVAAGPGAMITEYAGGGGPDPAVPPPIGGTPPADTPADAPGGTPPSGAPPGVDVQQVLENAVTGGGAAAPVRSKAQELLLNMLGNPSPYDNEAMNAEFQNLAGGIDADYDTRQRGLSDEFARRGLYGSVGKDFASGRAADTEVGRRSAKTQLASNLATKRATTYGDYVRNALDAARLGANESDQTEMDRLRQLTQFGDTAFQHDLATNQVNQGQSDDWQQYLEQLLNAGYE